MEADVFLVWLIVLGIIAIFTFNEIIGIVFPVVVLILSFIFGLDPLLVIIIMAIEITVNVIALGIGIMASIPKGNLSLRRLFSKTPTIFVASVVGIIAFLLIIFNTVGGILAFEMAIGTGSIFAVATLGIAVVVKKIQTTPRTCITINDLDPICFGREE